MQVTVHISELEDLKTRNICEILHELIIHTHPQMKAKIRYGIPFYDVYKWICYLNPLPTGGVELAFIAGKALYDAYGLLEAKERKMVKGITFHSIHEIDEEKVYYYLLQAIDEDERKNSKIT